jgi:hypothetical protein
MSDQSLRPVTSINRRDLLRLGLAAAGTAAVARIALPGGAQASDGEGSGGRIAVHAAIPGCPEAAKSLVSLEMGPLTVADKPTQIPGGVRELTTGMDWDYRLYGPGAAHWGQATFMFAPSDAGRLELQEWWGRCDGRTVEASASVDGETVRTFNLIDCFPTAFGTNGFDTASSAVHWTLEVRVDRIEMA